MSRNKIHQPFLLCLIVITALLLLSELPEISIGSWRFKKVDLLADVHPDVSDTVLLASRDTITGSLVARLVEKNCPSGLTCIEDYSGDSTALKYFFDALHSSREKPVRIAFYGDSFIEGDIFCGSFRDSLQSIFGGQGVGFMPITSHVPEFRNTIKHRFENWLTSSLINPIDSVGEIGPAGYCFIPLRDNQLEYRAASKRFLRQFGSIKLYYTNAGRASVHYTVDDDTLTRSEELEITQQLQEWSYREKTVRSVQFTFDPCDSLLLYGASFEGGPGVYVDNFSMRGNSGLNLSRIPAPMYKKFDQYRNYKLIVLQFGLNIAMEDSTRFDSYKRRMIRVIRTLQSVFPKASFLLLGVSDRSSNVNGTFETMNAIPLLRDAQREIARTAKIAFWDTFEAMGGANSMVRFVEANPPLASKDYTHINFRGGKLLAGKFVKCLLYAREKYEKKQQLEKARG